MSPGQEAEARSTISSALALRFGKTAALLMTIALIALGSYLAIFVLFLHWWARFPR